MDKIKECIDIASNEIEIVKNSQMDKKDKDLVILGMSLVRAKLTEFWLENN